MLKAVAADLTIKPDTVETLLYGNNPKRGVVGMDVDSDGSVALFLRDPDGVRRLVARHRHFFLLSDDSYLADYDGVTDIDCLSGEGHFRYACYYQSRSAMWKYLNRAIRNYGREQGAVYTKADLWRIPDILSISDSEEQFLISSCIGQFRGMEFSDLRRMQIALHADMPYEPEYTSLTDKRIALRQIALTDSAGWSHVIDSRDMPEKEMLRQFLILIKERDPDVIEGHDLFRTILPIIDMKCVQNGILFRAGRRMSFVENYSTTRMKDDRSIPFTNYVVPGRHIVDTMFLAEKSAPEYLIDIDAKDVAAVDAAVCGKAVRAENGDALARATATARISDALLPAEFFQAQMVPIPLGKLCMAGSAKKIDYLMIRAYLSAGHTIPKPPKPETFEGGLCEQFIAGRCENVVKIDVESQYPSLMIGEDIKPESDSLDVFLPMLKKLTWLRLEAKMKRDSASGPQRDRHDHLQKALKLLINSFYGYLGYRNAHFADFAAAARVTSLGRAVMKKMIETLDGAGYSLIQCDTDGAFFTPPFDPETDRERLTSVVEAVEKSLPQYLDIAVEGVWPAMLSLKKKNYALLAKDGSVSITGGILKSSADERFVRKALAATAECILKNDLAQLHAHLCALRKDVSDGRLSLPDIYFTETIRMNNQEYLEYIAGGGGRKPVHEGILKYRKNKGDRAFPVGNDVRHYHRDNQGQTSVLPSFSFEFDPEHPDYDRSHYLNRLSGALRRLNPLFTPEQFSLIFSRPPVEAVRRAAKKISVGATIVGKTASSGLDRYVELSSGYKKGKGIKRNVFVKADDEDAIREFREKNSDTDVYRSTYEYLCDRPPLHGLTRFCPKRGDFVIEIESETGEHVQNVSSAIAAARHCAEVIERTLSIPLSAITYCYNGGKSFYLTVPQKAFGLPDCIELNGIYECVARHIRDNMDEEHRGAMDMDLYNHDRPLRIQGTVHPKHGLYNTRLTTDEFFNLTAQDIIRLARFLREAPAPELLLDDFAGTQEIVRGLTKDFPRTETFNPNRKPFRVNMQAKNWRSKTAAYLKAHNISIRIPCVEALTALIHSGGSIGFDGRVKLITELRDTGSAEEEIISIFHDSPFFHQKYMNEIILPDSRSESMRGESGFMIRPDIWERYDGISCANCQKWCDPNQCYRNLKLSFFNEAVSPPYAGFRSMSQDALKTALSASLDPDNIIRNFFKINLIEAPMASGKTYQAVNAALVLAEQGRRSLILAPNHTT
jgi:DNA polymerase elongation subunit (family B)